MNNFVVINTYNSRIEAEVDKNKLNSKNILSYIEADDGGGAIPYLLYGTGFVKLLVKNDDYKKSSKLLGL